MRDQSDAPIKDGRNKRPFVSTRHRDAPPDTFDPNEPRLGRRDSEPHSAAITYLYDVLSTNFPNDRTMWDLHHYFKKKSVKIDIQFDISYFKGLKIPYELPSYRAKDFDNKVPTMAINILSVSTWRSDLSEKLDYCRLLEIPLYIVFPAYHVATKLYEPPFVRVYILQDSGDYQIREVRKVAVKSSGDWNTDAIIDVSNIVPFRIGLKKRERTFKDEETLYRLILLKPEKNELFLTENEKNKQTINKQSQTIEEQSQTIEEQSQTIEEQSQTIEEQSQTIEKISQRLEKLEAENIKLKDKLKKY
jgi:Uma2 family endonuclease/uncharacterized coiled-coil protein SlyX